MVAVSSAWRTVVVVLILQPLLTDPLLVVAREYRDALLLSRQLADAAAYQP